MEKNVSSVAEQDKTAEVKKNPKLIELARPYKGSPPHVRGKD